MTPPDSQPGPGERPRTGLVLLLIAIAAASAAALLYLTIQRELGWEISALSVATLGAAFAAFALERGQRSGLQVRTTSRERQLTRLSETLKAREEKNQELARRVDELTKLYRAISTVNSVQNPSHAYDSVVHAALELVGGDRGSLMLLDEKHEALIIRSQQGLGHAVAAGTRVMLGEGVAGWVVENRQPLLLVGRASEDSRFEHTEDRPVQSALCVPLQCHGEVIGVLNLACSDESGKSTFDEPDKNMAHIFAQHAAITASYARLWVRRGSVAS
jgi:transcriptional regulator with GAF, ATPase, and Fis domain